MGRREDIEARLRELEAEKAHLSNYGDDIYDDGDVIKFVKSFKAAKLNGRYTTSEFNGRYTTSEYRSTRAFTYVALKMNDKWYMTGRRDNEGRGWSWDSLVEFMYVGIPVEDITVVIAEDFRTRAELAAQLEATAAIIGTIDIPDFSIKRGGIRWNTPDSSGEEQADVVHADASNWVSPSHVEYTRVDTSFMGGESPDKYDVEPEVNTPVRDPSRAKNNEH